MTPANLKLFKDIMQTSSISRAASLNGITQSAATQHVQELERLFGVELLDRSRRPLQVTAPGRLYAEYCRNALRLREDFDSELEKMRAAIQGTVRVASIYSVGLSEMEQLEREFGRRLPDAQLEVEYLRPEKIYEAVLADQVDLGLVSYPEPSREISVRPWREEEMVLAVSPRHPLARKDTVEPRDLEGVDFIGFDDDLPIRRAIDQWLKENSVEVNLTMHFDNLQMIKEAVAHRVGVAIMPARIMLEEISQGRLVAIAIASPNLYRPLGIIYRKKKRFHRVAQAFLELLEEKPLAELSRR
jgi:DNA-binding transcriptional LysR family regulator